jgi:hypothetical protein
MRDWILAVALGLALCAPSRPSPSQSAVPALTSTDETVAGDAVPVEPKPWSGTVAEGFAQMRSLAEKLQLESARTVADALLAPNSFLRWKLDLAERGGWRKGIVDAVDPVLDLAGWNGLDPDARAEVWYAKGVIASLGKEREAADAAFWKARGMSSDVTLQRDAIYDLGVLALQAGEEERAKLPEVSGKPAQPAMPMPTLPGQPPQGGGLPGGGQPGAAPSPDPLQLARAAYLQAREHFVDRLRSEWQHADTQANVELCLKRLRELDEIEKKRKEEEQKKKDEQKQEQKQDQQQQDKKDEKSDEEKKDEEQQDEEKDPNEPKEDEKKPEEKPPEPKDEEAEKKDEKKDAQPTEAKDDQMSPAEITQLLDRLQRLEEEWKKLQAQMKAARRGKVKKDW